VCAFCKNSRQKLRYFIQLADKQKEQEQTGPQPMDNPIGKKQSIILGESILLPEQSIFFHLLHKTFFYPSSALQNEQGQITNKGYSRGL
jgi:hypothetical protein